VSGAAAIVVAGGTGERLGREGGKQLALVAGRPVLSWTVSALDAAAGVGLIVVVCHPEKVDEYRGVAIDPLGLSTPVRFAAGGVTRQDSVAAGLEAVPYDFDVVLVQDGARPLLTPSLVAMALEALDYAPDVAGVVVGYPASDTLKVVDRGHVLATPDRSRFWAVQTPQVFRSQALRGAYAAAAADAFSGTDDASLVERTGAKVVVVEGPRDNLKVTVAEDIVLVEAVLKFRGAEETS
jgi:2-C-methyl-D-erythritol 4-phosphate cytidylyltransferase